MKKKEHISVLPKEVLEAFSYPLHTFIDGTLGAGGHARLLIEAHPELHTYYGIDRDPMALEIAKNNLSSFSQVQYIQGSFIEGVKSILTQVDGILLDLGVSSMQLDTGERGFSFTKDGPLDMRMGPDAPYDAAYVVNSFSEKDLADIFYTYGEEHRSRRAAKGIVEERKKKKILTTMQLCDALAKWGFVRRGKNHPATKIFQALRIYVNQELELLEKGLELLFSMLAPRGRIAVISFHSLEDRIVKQFFKKTGLVLTKKPLTPTFEEKRANPRSGSAKLRVCQKE